MDMKFIFMNMRQFFKNLVSSNNESLIKRFSAIVIVISLILMAFLATFKTANWIVPEFIFDGLTWLAAGALGLTMVESIFIKKKKSLPPPRKESEPEIKLKKLDTKIGKKEK